MTAQIILKINHEIEYYYWLRKEESRDEVAIAQQPNVAKYIKGLIRADIGMKE